MHTLELQHSSTASILKPPRDSPGATVAGLTGICSATAAACDGIQATGGFRPQQGTALPASAAYIGATAAAEPATEAAMTEATMDGVGNGQWE